MATYSQNGTKSSLDECLSKGIKEDDIKIIDYIVDPSNYNPEKAFTNQDHSAILVEVCLFPSIFKLIKSKIAGYHLSFYNKITNKEYKINNIYFRDDFVDPMDESEIDLQGIADKITKVKQLLVYESQSSHDIKKAACHSTKLDKFIDLQGTTDFGKLARDFLLADKSIDDDIQLQMPIFAVASSQSSMADDSTSGNAVYKHVIHYRSPELNERVSINETREKYKKSVKKASSEGYIAELSVPETSNPAEGSHIVFGDWVTYSSEVFESKRRIEVPKEIFLGDSNSIEITFTPIFKGKENAGEKSVIELSFYESIKKLYMPEIPPRVEVFRNNMGSVSLAVHRGDPATSRVALQTSYYDANEAKVKNFSSDILTFDHMGHIGSDYKVLMDHECKNFGPFKGMITVSSITEFGSSIGTELVIPTIKVANYKETFIPDNIQVHAFNQPKGIIVEVNNVSYTNFASLSLYRENMSVSSSSPNRIAYMGKFSTSTDINYFDQDVLYGHVYRYFGCVEVKHNREHNQAQIVYEKVKFSGDAIIQRISGPSSSLYSPKITILDTFIPGPPSFSIDTNVVRSDEDFLRTKFSESIVGKAAYSSIKEFIDNNGIEKLVVYLVHRINNETGQKSFVGQYTNGEVFKDNTPGFKLTDRHTYVFLMCLIDPLSIMGSVNGDNSLSKTIQKEIIAMTGALPSDKEIEDFSSVDFLTGVTVIKKYRPPISSTYIDNLKGQEILEGFNDGRPSIKLSWSPSSISNKLTLTYYVLCEYQGYTSVIQTIPAWDSAHLYFYVDSDIYNEVGVKSYYVIPKFDDLTFGDPSNKVSYTKGYDLHKAIADNAYVYEIPGKKGITKLLGDTKKIF